MSKSNDKQDKNQSIIVETAIGSIILIILYLSSFYSYLIFHSLAEMFSIIVGVSIFFIAL